MVTVALASLFIAQSSSSGPSEWIFDVEGKTREATVYLPAGKGPHPVVFAFHGHGGNRRNASRMFRIHELWPEAIAVYMQGIPTKSFYDPEGSRNGWQNSAGEVGDRDLKFFDAVYERVIRRANGDANRVYACGHSNGGRFTYLLWSSRGDRFAAFGPSAAPGFRLIREVQPKPAFVIGGTEDRLVPFAAQRATIDEIKRLNGVSGEGKVAGYITSYTGKSANLKTYIYPGGHQYPQEANRPLVDFFKSHRK